MGKNNKNIEFKKERLGEVRKNKEVLGNYKMKIIEYNKANDIVVEFQDRYKAKVRTRYSHFKNGDVKNPYHPSIFNIGYIGEGKFKSRDEKGNKTIEYIVWRNMIQRCYDPYTINKHLTYKDCFVCEEWHNFQNFAKWYEENYYECNNERMELDKDILIKGNKVYSPTTCIFVPDRINILFVKNDKNRGEYPIGVHWRNDVKKFVARCSTSNKDKKRIHLGLYDTVNEAFYCYKQFKESYIKQVADEYKDLIPKELYDAMYNYEVEIND